MFGWFKQDHRQEGFDYAKQMLAEGTYSIKELQEQADAVDLEDAPSSFEFDLGIADYLRSLRYTNPKALSED